MWARYISCTSVVLMLSGTLAYAQCQSGAHLSCAVYTTCFDKYCPCEATGDGYFIRYGKKYCDRFLASTGWSKKGNKWRNQTLLCLQESIVPKLSITEPPKCDCSCFPKGSASAVDHQRA